jgi:hypothetical protein
MALSRVSPARVRGEPRDRGKQGPASLASTDPERALRLRARRRAEPGPALLSPLHHSGLSMARGCASSFPRPLVVQCRSGHQSRAHAALEPIPLAADHFHILSSVASHEPDCVIAVVTPQPCLSVRQWTAAIRSHSPVESQDHQRHPTPYLLHSRGPNRDRHPQPAGVLRHGVGACQNPFEIS